MEQEPYFVTIDESLVGRKAGESAAEKARELRAQNPFRTTLARLTGAHTDERAWRRGASGERQTSWWLKRLPDGWYLFDDIPVGDRGANIDHVVVGPGGVFTVNTKNLTGTIWVGPRTILHNGHRTDWLPKATSEAARASRLLSAALGRPVGVRPALATLVEERTIKELPADVFVGGPRGLRRWLLEQPVTLSSREVLELAGAIAKPATWKTRGAQTGAACVCGGEMVPRKRRSDGEPFLGCSRFPRCRRVSPA